MIISVGSRAASKSSVQDFSLHLFDCDIELTDNYNLCVLSLLLLKKKKAYTWTELLFSELKTIQLKMLKSKDSSLLDQGNILYGQINRVRLHLKIANLGYVLGIVLSFTTSNTFIFSLEFCFLWFLLS